MFDGRKRRIFIKTKSEMDITIKIDLDVKNLKI